MQTVILKNSCTCLNCFYLWVKRQFVTFMSGIFNTFHVLSWEPPLKMFFAFMFSFLFTVCLNNVNLCGASTECFNRPQPPNADPSTLAYVCNCGSSLMVGDDCMTTAPRKFWLKEMILFLRSSFFVLEMTITPICDTGAEGTYLAHGQRYSGGKGPPDRNRT